MIGDALGARIGVLLIGASAVAARSVEKALGQLGAHGFLLHCVDRLDAAVALLPADVVLLDVSLPGCCGRDALASLLAAAPDTPVIALVAPAEERLGLELVEAGAEDYLVREGLDGRPLARALGCALRRRQRRRAPQLRERAFVERSRLAALSADVSDALARGDSLAGMLEQCAAALARHTGAATAGIWVLNEADDALELRATGGGDLRLKECGGCIPLAPDVVVGRVACLRQPALTNAAPDDACIPDREWARRESIIAFAGYPLLVDDRLVGVLGVFAREPLSVAALNDLAAVADSIAQCCDRWRLEGTRAQLAAIIEASPQFIATASPDGLLLTLNAAGRKMLGLGPDERIADLSLADLYPEREKVLLVGERLPVALREGTWSGEAMLRDAEGREVAVFQTLLAHRKPDGAPEFLSTIIQDMSAQKQLEEELRQSQKMDAVGRLAGGIAHDFNNLLMPIMSYAELLAEGLGPAHPLHRFAAEVARTAERAASLPRQLLAFSRRQVLQPKVLDLNEVVHGMERMLQRLIGEHITLRIAPCADLGKVRADPGQIEQILMNLAVNSRDAMPRGGSLVIETTNVDLDPEYARRRPGVTLGPYVCLAISDTGCGMDRATQSRIFEPFFTTKGLGEGTGLGLSTVYGIVTQSGGYIRVYSELNRGTTFRIYLPRVDDLPDAEPGPASAAAVTNGSETLLLVEDDALVRSTVRDMLQLRGYSVLEAAGAEEALVLSASTPGTIHLLVTDVVMPGLSGPELADCLMAFRPGLKALYMSGYTASAIVHHGVLDAGIGFIEKPFTRDTILRRVRDLLDGRTGEAS